MNKKTKYNKAAVAAAVTAASVVAEWLFDVSIPAAVQGAITTLAVFLVPNIEE